MEQFTYPTSEGLYSAAYYTADLPVPYGRSAEVALTRGKKQGDISSPLLFGLIFNALILALNPRTDRKEFRTKSRIMYGIPYNLILSLIL
jgi:hypothetical protein